MLNTRRRISVGAIVSRVLRYWSAAARNALCRGPVTGESQVVVSLTSHGTRIDSVALTIESIAAGRAKPSQLILWVDDNDDFERATRHRAIRRLVSRGLTVSVARPMGPHAKYYPYVDLVEMHSVPLVTADDDILYPRKWLEGLLAALDKEPAVIHCYRAHRFSLLNGEPAPYMTWPPAVGTDARLSNFLTGVSGVIYPPVFLNLLKQEGESFRRLAPKADDVWINSRAVKHGVPVAQITPNAVLFPVLLGTQREALWRHNTGGNDSQISASYSSDLVAVISEEIRRVG